jgi:hypothetical protein
MRHAALVHGDDRVEAARTAGGLRDAAKLRTPDLVGCAMRLWFMVMIASRRRGPRVA